MGSAIDKYSLDTVRDVRGHTKGMPLVDRAIREENVCTCNVSTTVKLICGVNKSYDILRRNIKDLLADVRVVVQS